MPPEVHSNCTNKSRRVLVRRFPLASFLYVVFTSWPNAISSSCHRDGPPHAYVPRCWPLFRPSEGPTYAFQVARLPHCELSQRINTKSFFWWQAKKIDEKFHRTNISRQPQKSIDTPLGRTINLNAAKRNTAHQDADENEIFAAECPVRARKLGRPTHLVKKGTTMRVTRHSGTLLPSALLRRRQVRPPGTRRSQSRSLEGNAQKGSERGETGFWLRVECIGAP